MKKIITSIYGILSNPFRPVDKSEIRVIVAGAAGRGKTSVMLAIAAALEKTMPNTQVIVHNNVRRATPMEDYEKGNDVRLPFIEMQLDKITLYEVQTNDRGALKGSNPPVTA